ncbi:MAG: hypothetical protein FVQ83_13240 [Chloroflexi bacterium]|nr:hypothetical protein [Chloroflexota bacterium]
MKSIVDEAKGWVAVIVGFIACPCHLPITFPILLSLTAGTAFGAWLTNNTIMFGSILTVIFLVGLGLGFYWINETGKSAPNLASGPKSVVVVTSSVCDTCEDTISLWKTLKKDYRFNLKIVDLNTKEGRRFAGEKSIFSTPVTLINDRIAFRGLPKLARATAALKS